MTRELQGAIERARRSGDPHDSLIVARLCREERELMESLHWYRFYLAARRDDRAARREMQQVLKLQPLQEQAEKAKTSRGNARVRERMSGNLCRCTGYTKIYLAVMATSLVLSNQAENLDQAIEQLKHAG